MSECTVPLDRDKKFFMAYTNCFNFFTVERLYQGRSYKMQPNSKLLTLPTYTPEFMEKPLLYFMYMPKFF